MGRHVVVISEDAMVYEDTRRLRELPVFSSVWDQCAVVKKVRSIYPTVTYPCHTSMMTGCYPDRTGVYNNEVDHLFEKASDWHWFYRDVKVPSIFDAAKKKGLSTGSVFWPVTGNCGSIDYLIDEYWPQADDESMRECFLHAGTSEEVAKKCIDPNLWLQVNRTHPWCDDFVHACACSMIRSYKPDLLMIHPGLIDGYRHETGVFSDKVEHALHETDHCLGWILKAARDAGIYEDTDFFIVSDHGQMNISRVVCPNVEFARRNLVSVDMSGRVTDYVAAFHSAGASGQIFLKNPDSKEDYERVCAVLKDMCASGIYGFSEVLTAGEAQERYHLAGGFSFVIETDGYTAFANDWTGPMVREQTDGRDYRFGHATHGYMPEKGPQPTLIAFGPDIRPGASVETCRLVDEPATLARVLGLEMDGIDGRCIEEILR